LQTAEKQQKADWGSGGRRFESGHPDQPSLASPCASYGWQAKVFPAIAASRTRRIRRVDIRGHDLRRTAASLMAIGRVPRFVISRILNHSEDRDITSVFDRYGYDAEKKAAMEFWNRLLSAVLKSRAASTVGRFNVR
jgi:integrase